MYKMHIDGTEIKEATKIGGRNVFITNYIDHRRWFSL